MTAPTGHVATTVLPVADDTHTVENSDGELATDALRDGEAGLDALTDGDLALDTLGDDETSLHWA